MLLDYLGFWQPQEPVEPDEPLLRILPRRRTRRPKPEPISGTVVLEAAVETTAVATLRFKGEASMDLALHGQAKGVVIDRRGEEDLLLLLAIDPLE